ncbi:MAG: NUDIX hydrolase [Acidimicrobiales bacterium]|nr:NUDIX hydrolase [Acidimicrobiales bacterium]HLV91124.1 NUDIX hydrolase [Acidimicrobiia bacterium]
MNGIAVTVDAVVFVDTPEGTAVLLIERANPPFQGRLALPGGFVDPGEDLPVAVARELEEETGVTGVELTQLGAYGTPGRDPRGHTVSIVYWGVADPSTRPVAGDDAARARLVPLGEIGPDTLAFDHDMILEDAVAALRRSRRPDQPKSTEASSE